MATRKSRYYGYARRSYRGRSYSSKSGKFGVYANAQFFTGLAGSFVPVNIPPIAQIAITGLAVAPVKLPGGVKMAAQGYVLGKLIQNFTGNPLAKTTATNSGWY